MQRKHCNNVLPDNSVFCQFCGNPPETTPAPQVSSAPANPNPPTPHYAPAPPPAEKTVYCRQCGHPIDNDTKQCTGCGKQYFRGIKPMTFLCIVMGLAIATLAVVCLVMDAQYQERIAELEQLLASYRF